MKKQVTATFLPKKKWWQKPKEEQFRAYGRRDEILREMGFSSYAAYTLCGRCHRGIEFNRYGKVPLQQANKTLRKRKRKVAKNKSWDDSPEYRRLWSEKKRLLAMPDRDAVRERLNEIRKLLRNIVRDRAGL